ncbi:MAG: DNA/RNA non-specific endonuclease [Chloroflexota bacterium]|nr:DNA/RNA non-specific endonuclease [Chloroflexota bacterium]
MDWVIGKAVAGLKKVGGLFTGKGKGKGTDPSKDAAKGTKPGSTPADPKAAGTPQPTAAQPGADARTMDQKKADLAAGLAEANKLLKDDTLDDAQIKKLLPTIKAKYHMTALELVVDRTNDAEGEETAHVHGTINPDDVGPPVTRTNLDRYKPIKMLRTVQGTGDAAVIIVEYETGTGSKFRVTLGKDDMVQSIKGTHLRLKHQTGIKDRQDTQDPPTHVANMDMNRSHMIADEFGGSGYANSLNLLTTSAHYNQKTMREQERLIKRSIIVNNADEFELDVSVTWGAFNSDTVRNLIMQNRELREKFRQHPEKLEPKLDAYLKTCKDLRKQNLQRVMDTRYIWAVLAGNKRTDFGPASIGPDLWIGT